MLFINRVVGVAMCHTCWWRSCCHRHALRRHGSWIGCHAVVVISHWRWDLLVMANGRWRWRILLRVALRRKMWSRWHLSWGVHGMRSHGLNLHWRWWSWSWARRKMSLAVLARWGRRRNRRRMWKRASWRARHVHVLCWLTADWLWVKRGRRDYGRLRSGLWRRWFLFMRNQKSVAAACEVCLLGDVECMIEEEAMWVVGRKDIPFIQK